MSFVPNTDGFIFRFETDLLSGVLQPTGHRHGIRRLVHKPSGLGLVHRDFALLNLYFLLARGRCLASARSIHRTVTHHDDTVRIVWSPTDLHRADLILTYRQAGQNAIDLSVTVRAREEYAAYEAFVASYFDLAFRPHICTSGGSFSSEHHWYTPVLQNLYRDNALVFPRDPQAGQLHLDGRWQNVRSVYLWKSEQYYAYPLAMQVHAERGFAVLLMAKRDLCPTVCWTVGLADVGTSSYQSDHMDDPENARNPLYLSLFGTDLQPGDHLTAHLRLAVVDLDPGWNAPLEACRVWKTNSNANWNLKAAPSTRKESLYAHRR